MDAKRQWAHTRRARTRDKVLTATANLLRAKGYSELTMDSVASASAVAKTTLYRQWPTKAALCMDLYLEIAGKELLVPDTGDVTNDLKKVASDVVHLQTTTPAGIAFVGLIAEAQRQPQTRAAFQEFAARRRTITREVLRRGIDRGQLRPDTDIDLFIDALGGATAFRLLQGHAPLNKRFTNALVDLLLRGCRREA